MPLGEILADGILGFLFQRMRAGTVCWLCIAGTLGLGWFLTANYAPASEVRELQDEFVELKSEDIAKRIFDYRVRQCDTPEEQRQEKRWLAEQLRVEAERFEKITHRPFAIPACGEL